MTDGRLTVSFAYAHQGLLESVLSKAVVWPTSNSSDVEKYQLNKDTKHNNYVREISIKMIHYHLRNGFKWKFRVP